MATLPATGVLAADKINPRAFGSKVPYAIEREFNLATLLAAVIANADVINLFELPAEHVIIASAQEVVTAGTKDATTFTLQLRVGTTALGAALDVTTGAGKAIGGNATYNLPLVSAAAANVNLVAVVSGGNAVSTLNPVVRVKLLVCDMGD